MRPPLLHRRRTQPARLSAIVRPSRVDRMARGQALVEFALVLPLLIVLFAAVLDLGRISFARIAIANAAREGALQAAVTPSSYAVGQPCPSDGASNLVICRTVLESRGSSISILPADITMSCAPADCTPGIGNTATVEVSTRFELLTPVIALFFGGSRNITLTASSVAQIETLPTPAFTPPWEPSPAPSASVGPSPSPSPSQAICSLPSAGFSFDVSPSNSRAPIQLSVTDTSTDGGCPITSWAWDWGDGMQDFVQAPISHPYNAPGDYSITLTVGNSAGSNTTGAIVIRVKP